MKTVPNTNRFLGLGHNAKLTKLLHQIEKHVRHAKSDAELIDAISLLDHMPAPIKYQPSISKTIARYSSYFFAIVAAGLILAGAPRASAVAFFGLAIFCYMAARISEGNETDRLIHLSEQIHQRSRLFDYGLRADTPSQTPNFKGIYRQFHIFQHGSYSSRIRHLLSGTYEGTDHSFPYQYFQVTYTSHTRASLAGKDMRPLDRCGFIVPFAHVKNLRISDHALKLFKPTWHSGSNDFNARFAVEASEDMATAKFLKPALLKEIEAAGKALSFMDLEFNDAGELCFSFDDTTTLTGMRRTGLHDPKAFKQEILEHNSMPNLDAALEFLHRLMKYSDNNFDQNTNLKTGSTT